MGTPNREPSNTPVPEPTVQQPPQDDDDPVERELNHLFQEGRERKKKRLSLKRCNGTSDHKRVQPEPQGQQHPVSSSSNQQRGQTHLLNNGSRNPTASVLETTMNGPGDFDSAAEGPTPAHTPPTNPVRSSSPVMSDAGGLLDGAEAYTDAFADEIINQLMLRYEPAVRGHIYEILPALLKEFSVRMSYQSESREHRDLAWIAHQSCEATRTQLKATAADSDMCMEEDTKINRTYDDPDGRTTQFHARLALLYRDAREPAVYDTEKTPDLKLPTHDFERYRTHLWGSKPMNWLENALSAAIRLRGIEPTEMHSARRHMLNSLDELRNFAGHSDHDISRWRAPAAYRVMFHVAWSPLDFVKKQEFVDISDNLLENVITLTGDGDMVQTCTASEYMNQTWRSAGAELLRLIAKLVRDPSSAQRGKLDDETTLVVFMDFDELQVDAVGTLYGLAQVVEQLVWIGSALQSPPDLDDFQSFHCYSFQNAFGFSTTSLITHFASSEHGPSTKARPVASMEYTIEYTIEPFFPSTSNSSTGDVSACWHPIFRSFVVAKGFPIPTRPDHRPGMEISFDLMSHLIQGKWLTAFMGGLFVKALTRMLHVTDFVDENCIFWHFLASKDNSRVSYADPSVAPLQGNLQAGAILELVKTGQARHFVGWSSNVKNLVGSPEADYNIRVSSLPPPPSKGVLDKLQIGVSMQVTAIPSVTLASKSVLFHDVGTRNAWLIDGASALLHLVRASLEYDKQGRFFRSRYVHRPDSVSLFEAEEPFTGADAAFEMLTNVQNLAFILSETQVFDRTSPGEINKSREYLQDRIESILHILEKMIEAQAVASRDDGFHFTLSSPPWNTHLVGFDFKNVAQQNCPFFPLAAEVRASGRSWIELIRAVGAIVLFGVGFGQLIQPHAPADDVHGLSLTLKPCGSCAWNTPAPLGHDLLAVCERDLEWLIHEYGDGSSNDRILQTEQSRRVINNIYWEDTELYDTRTYGIEPHDTAAERRQQQQRPRPRCRDRQACSMGRCQTTTPGGTFELSFKRRTCWLRRGCVASERAAPL
ncbi:hypothetical protein ACJ41O_008695 [Fusarium nematophilum]